MLVAERYLAVVRFDQVPANVTEEGYDARDHDSDYADGDKDDDYGSSHMIKATITSSGDDQNMAHQVLTNQFRRPRPATPRLRYHHHASSSTRNTGVLEI